ncbi:MAG: P-loop NTPase [Actinomycetota bacterium]|jgi:ATP-binding protein involved in chromosome partitioning|nr:P-loop NTPase [Actinomycetota bacterium]
MEGACNAALTVLQTIKPEGIIVVTTPQDMVTNIAHHSQDMADAIGTEVIGLVMNMAYVVCPHCPERIDVFGTLTEAPEGGPAQLATRPLVPDWAALADGGRTADAATEEFDALAERVLSEIGVELTDA